MGRIVTLKRRVNILRVVNEIHFAILVHGREHYKSDFGYAFLFATIEQLLLYKVNENVASL